jgi:predicted nucleic acid-binding protein
VNRGLIYLDSSAVMKLVFEERETQALTEFLRAWPNRTSSALARVEVMVSVRRVHDKDIHREALNILGGINLVHPDQGMFAAASATDPPVVRALDAIHLATAVSLGHELAGMVVYDVRLAEAARHAGITVWAPS